MSSTTFLVALMIGAALVAMWIHVRFPKLAPDHLGKTLLHTGIAFALLQLSPGFVESPVMALVAIVLVVLPAFVYTLLCTIWMLRHMQTAIL
jgi:hypothetical protein